MMAATVASASASLVDQLLTLMRMAAWPCQVVPPSQAVPLGLHPAMTVRVWVARRHRPVRRVA